MGLGRLLPRRLDQYRTVIIEMTFHADIRVFPWRNSDWCFTEWARRCNPIMLVLVILGAFMGLREEVVTTESLTTVLAFER